MKPLPAQLVFETLANLRDRIAGDSSLCLFETLAGRAIEYRSGADDRAALSPAHLVRVEDVRLRWTLDTRRIVRSVYLQQSEAQALKFNLSHQALEPTPTPGTDVECTSSPQQWSPRRGRGWACSTISCAILDAMQRSPFSHGTRLSRRSSIEATLLPPLWRLS